jgi:two-component system, response regulator PdtaR
MTGEGGPALERDVGAAQQETILVVEDEVLVRAAVTTHLRECGLKVIEASSADEAVHALGADRTIRLVFSDVNMPGQMDGNDLARWLQRERPAIKILLASGAVWMEGTVVEGVPRLTKPYSFFEMERVVMDMLSEV